MTGSKDDDWSPLPYNLYHNSPSPLCLQGMLKNSFTVLTDTLICAGLYNCTVKQRPQTVCACVDVKDGSILRWWHAVHRSVDLCLRSPPLMRGLFFTVLSSLSCSPFPMLHRSLSNSVLFNPHLHLCPFSDSTFTHIEYSHTHPHTSINNNKQFHCIAADWWGEKTEGKLIE